VPSHNFALVGSQLVTRLLQLILRGKRETTTLSSMPLMHAIRRVSSITACYYCFAAAVASIFSSGPELS